MFYKRQKHSYSDGDLVNASTLAELCGVSPAAITKAKASGRIDTFEDEKGKECFHRIRSVQQYLESRDRRHVTTPTRAQRTAGFDNLTAQATAHNAKYDVPTPNFGVELPGVTDTDDPLDFGGAVAERADLATSKAFKEQQMARIAKLKADEMEGRLVPKQQAAIIVYKIGANIQEKVGTLYSQLAPEIVGYFKDVMGRCGVSAEKIIEIAGDADHYIGEKIRTACLNSLKELSEMSIDNILDG